LSAGRSAIVDAANTQRWQRAIFIELAQRVKKRFVVVETTADESTIARRMAERGNDATEVSDATMRVHDLMRAAREPLEDVPSAARVTTTSGHGDALGLRVAEALLTQ
jgi:predicted kinase